jgi:AcrR family transcriptional regulator
MSRLDREEALERMALLLSANPGATLLELVEASQVPRATFYRWFKDRDALEVEIDTWGMGRLDWLLSQAQPDLTDVLRVLIEAGPIVRAIYLRRERLKIEPPDPAAAFLTAAFDRHLANHLHLIRYDLAWIDECISSLIYGAWRYMSRGQRTSSDVAMMLEETIFRGLFQEVV